MDRFVAERRRISSDSGLTRLFDAGHSPVEGRDQLVELTREILCGYRQGPTPPRRLSRRETFQTSPHFAQRQYVLTSGLFAVVVIDDDRQAGHVEGVFAGSFELDRVPMSLRESNVTRLSIDLPHNFALGHFQLCGHRVFVSARHTRGTPASELPSAKPSQNCELEGGELNWTLYHREPSFRDLTWRHGSANDERVEDSCRNDGDDRRYDGWRKRSRRFD